MGSHRGQHHVLAFLHIAMTPHLPTKQTLGIADSIVNLDCELDGIYNHHGNVSLSMSLWKFLDLFCWRKKTHPKCGQHHVMRPRFWTEKKKIQQAEYQHPSPSSASHSCHMPPQPWWTAPLNWEPQQAPPSFSYSTRCFVTGLRKITDLVRFQTEK